MSTSERPRLSRPSHWLAFGLGAGLAPKAPGTFGTLAALPLYLLMAPLPLPVYVLITSVFFLLGVVWCGRTARDLGVHDHPGIVWDEVVGFLVTMTAAPSGWWGIVAGFVAFRGFDIIKPWPISWLDRRVGGGWGIMLDDLLAGLFALVLLQSLFRLGS